MNELMIVFNNGAGYLYYKTNAVTAREAYKEFQDKLEKDGIDISNVSFEIKEIRLRNDDFEDIDYIVYF